MKFRRGHSYDTLSAQLLICLNPWQSLFHTLLPANNTEEEQLHSLRWPQDAHQPRIQNALISVMLAQIILNLMLKDFE